MNVLVLAAHPDDEVLGCGGAIARHAQQGDQVHIVILAEGLTSRTTQRNREQHHAGLSDLAQAAQDASQVLGTASLTLHDFPDNRMDRCDLLDIVKVVEASIQQHNPAVIYTHHAGDVNIDHQRVHQAVVTAARPLPGHQVKTLLFFEVVSSTEWQPPGSAPMFTPNWFVDISATLSLKHKALDCYHSEMHGFPHPRSLAAVEHLARWRGATVGVEAAEAFMLGRCLVN